MSSGETPHQRSGGEVSQFIEGAVERGLIPQMTSEEAQAAQRLLGPSLDRVKAWSSLHPVIDLAGVLPTTLLMCVQFPHMGVNETALRVESCFWITAIDTYLDDPKTKPDEAEQLAAECIRIALAPAGRCTAITDYGAVLLDLKRSLAAYPFFEPLQSVWAVTVTRLLDSMMFEYWASRHRREGSSPEKLLSLAEYLYFARHTIGLPFVWFTGTILADDRSVASILPTLMEVTDLCGTAMRLANDIRTFEREDLLGEVNALHLIAANLSSLPGREGLEIAKREAELLISQALRMARGVARLLDSENGLGERFIRATEFGVELYTKSDYHNDDFG